MAELTRRRDKESQQECWHIYFDDVQIGTISLRSGIPHDKHPWGWTAVSTPDRSRVSIAAVRQRPSFRHALILRPRGVSSSPTGPKPTLRRGAGNGTGRRKS